MRTDQTSRQIHVKDPTYYSNTQFSVVNVNSFIASLLTSDSFIIDCNSTLIAFRSTNRIFIRMTEIIEPKDPKSVSSDAIDLIKREVKCSLEREKN